MKTAIEKQLFLLQIIQEKMLISKNNSILIKITELKDSPESFITFLSVLQKAGILCVISIEKIKEEPSTYSVMLQPTTMFQPTRIINLQDLEKNNLTNNDILEINVSSEFYNYFLDFCKENKISDGSPDKKLLEIIDKKEVEKIKTEIFDKQIMWRCPICRAKLTPITSENIEHYLDLFKKDQPKSCIKGHHNQFQIKNGKLQFCTPPLSFEELQKYKLIQPIDTQKKEGYNYK